MSETRVFTDKMRLFSITKRDPLSMALVAAAVFIILFIAFELLRGLHRYHVPFALPAAERQGPAGIITAGLSTGGLELSGWAPLQTSVQIRDRDKILSTAAVSPEGKWSAIFIYDRHGKTIQVLTAAFQEKDKATDFAELGIFAPSKSYEDAYIWQEGLSSTRLLQVPSGMEDSDLYLALAWQSMDQTILFGGHATPNSLIQIYTDNEYVAAAPVGGDGLWMTKPFLKADHKSAELRFDDIQGKEVIDRRTYKLNWTDVKDGWNATWSIEEGKDQAVLILKPSAGEMSSASEEKPGQVIPAEMPQNKGNQY